ncbi:MAG TPA: 2OG-Fe(II) oxygenase [Candidatus Binatia bacterium]|nr:2OG-Fe(II) oxygenase [Candidatus Binatia bacterium]
MYRQDVFNSLPRLADEFQTAQPFKHTVVDHLFDDEFLRRVADEFYPPDDFRWYRFNNEREGKLAISNGEHYLPSTIKQFVRELNAEPFLRRLSALTGIQGLIPDPYLAGGGMHCIPRGGKLEIHADFNKHPLMNVDRRLNILIYLNKDWQELYGGHLELWDRSMQKCVKRIAPIFNRTVIFLTDDFSFHGHPEALNCPEHWTRKSIAMYYYTHGRPASELREAAAHDTTFPERAKEQQQNQAFASAQPPLLSKTPVSILSLAKELLKRFSGEKR